MAIHGKAGICLYFLSLHFLIFYSLTEITKEWSKVEMQFRPQSLSTKIIPTLLLQKHDQFSGLLSLLLSSVLC